MCRSRRYNSSPAGFVILTLAALLCTTSVSQASGHTDTTVTVKAGSVTVKDSTVTVVDTTVVPLITVGPDTTTTAVDTVRAREAHPQDAPVDRGFLIRTSDGSAELRLLGSIRLTALFDFNGLQTSSSFNTYAIPVGEANVDERRFEMNAGETRLGVEVTRRTSLGDIFVKVETDFLGPSGTLRLRHAYGTFWGFLAGQTWSTFGDPNSIPLTVDLDGPNSSVSVRTVQIRYTSRIDTALTWSAAIESPSLEATIPDSIGLQPSFQRFPDVIARIRQSESWGHVQLAGVLRSITIRNPTGDLDALAGVGFLVSGRVFLGGERPHRVLYQLVAGKGISRFITALSGEGLDLVYNPTTQSFDVASSLGTYVSYAREWTSNLLSYLTVGWISLGNIEDRPDDAFKQSAYVSANLFWDPSAGLRMGGEYSWGQRVNKDGQKGTANRISAVLRYDF
jgi:hypothetical protein